MRTTARPVLFVTNYAPEYRIRAFRRLHETENVEFALVGGALRHGGPLALPGEDDLTPSEQRQLPPSGGDSVTSSDELEQTKVDCGFPITPASQKQIYQLAASGRYRAVIVGISARTALLSAWAGARRAGIPFILWTSLWSHPRTFAHLCSYLPLRHIYRNADAIVTYGPHVSQYIRGKGSKKPIFVARQNVDNEFWAKNVQKTRLGARFQLMFSGRLSGEKGLQVLYKAWRASGLQAPQAALVLVGDGPFRARTVATGAALENAGEAKICSESHSPTQHDSDLMAQEHPRRQHSSLAAIDRSHYSDENDQSGIFHVGPRTPEEVRSFYAGSDAVVLPSIRTRDFCEPWGLVVNEAFNQGVPVIASDAVGAAAGGLVRHSETGLIFPSEDHEALAQAIRKLHDDHETREKLGKQAKQAVGSYTHHTWANGVSDALAALGVSELATQDRLVSDQAYESILTSSTQRDG